MVFVLSFQKICMVAQNLSGSTVGWVYIQTSWHRRSKNGQKQFPTTQQLNCRPHQWTRTAKPINLIHVITGQHSSPCWVHTVHVNILLWVTKKWW